MRLHALCCSASPTFQHRTPTLTASSSIDTDTPCRKKYFTSVERLRMAQEIATQNRKKHFRKGTCLSFSSSTIDLGTRPATSQGITRCPSRQPLVPAKMPKLFVVRLDKDLPSEEQARWFLGLPDKVRRQQFSREEQVSLTARCEIALKRTSRESKIEVVNPGSSVGPDDSASSEPSRNLSASTDNGTSHNEGSLEIHAGSTSRFEAVNTENELLKSYSRPRSSEATNFSRQNSLPPPPPPPPTNVSPNEHKPRRKSLHRAQSLTPLPLPPPTLAPVPPLPSPSTILPFSSHFRKVSRPSIDRAPTSSEIPPEAKFYQDREAREQLRQHVASPEKFDEMIEFGFLSPDELPSPSAGIVQSLPLQHPPSNVTQDRDRDDESVEAPSPRTPPAISDNLITAVRESSSIDSGIVLPLQDNALSKTPKARSPASSVGNRELTIHMTLTRSDLRTPEDELYSAQRRHTSGVEVEKVDPLALENLTVCDDPTGAHGAFAVRGDSTPKGLKRVLRSIRRH